MYGDFVLAGFFCFCFYSVALVAYNDCARSLKFYIRKTDSVAVYNGAAFTAIDTALLIQAAMLVAGIKGILNTAPILPLTTFGL